MESPRPQPTPGGLNAYLGKGSKVTGKLYFDGTARVDGQVEGEVTTTDTLIVGETAVVNAQITGETITIHGKVTGDINARKRVVLKAPGKLYGNIVSPALVIEEGVVFEGHCSMSSAAESKVTPIRKDEPAAASSSGQPGAAKQPASSTQASAPSAPQKATNERKQ